MPLVLAVHGSALPAAGATVGRLCDAVERRTGVRPRVGHLDHQIPSLSSALGACDGSDTADGASRADAGGATDMTGGADAAGASTTGAVVVPLLLGDGFHRTVDIPAVVAAHGGPGWVLTPSLSGAFEVDAALAGRLARAEAAQGGRVDAIVFAAAGSSQPDGNGGALLAARRLAGRRPGTPVVTAYCSATGPTVPQALAGLRAAGHRRIGIVTHLLAPGRFTASLGAAGADLVTEPLADHPAVADLVVRRYREAAPDAGRAARRIAHVAA
ncbi:sirohydrochlorin chelatase [Streptomyces sp. NPDC050400]|uniref:sirohydrochlorin chelatase n=1 Tax=Streptomyces sp. NPDC050400 TaxID=3365610 RepID=UPI0037BC1648